MQNRILETAIFSIIILFISCKVRPETSSTKMVGWEPGFETNEAERSLSIMAANSVVMLSVKIRNSGKSASFCSGTYVGNKKIITAAHCTTMGNRWIKDDKRNGIESDIIAQFGVLRPRKGTMTILRPFQEIVVNKMIPHNGYKLRKVDEVDKYTHGSQNDIAVFHLKSDPNKKEYPAAAVFKASKNELLSMLEKEKIEKVRLFGTGKGYKIPNNTPRKDIDIEKINGYPGLITTSATLTNRWFRDTKTVNKAELFELTPTKGTHLFKGDSGGPVFIFLNGQHTLIGVSVFVSDNAKGKIDTKNPKIYAEFTGAYLEFLN